MGENEHEARMARPPIAAGALFFDEAHGVLKVSSKDYWDIPVATSNTVRKASSGAVASTLANPDPSPKAAAIPKNASHLLILRS
jgi:hypothetical protein